MRRRGEQDFASVATEGRLLARPDRVEDKGPAGLQKLTIPGSRREGLLYVPKSYRPERPAALAVMFHGAGGSAHDGLGLLQDYLEDTGLILLAPGSDGGTWDIILGGYGPDVTCLDQDLDYVFSRYGVDAEHLAVGGFSDGASYALSIGIINGQLFSHIIAFSPGFMAPTRQPDSPRIYISHGTEDPVLPIGACSRRLVPALERAGYEVRYREFAGEHTIPAAVRREAVDWLLSG